MRSSSLLFNYLKILGQLQLLVCWVPRQTFPFFVSHTSFWISRQIICLSHSISIPFASVVIFYLFIYFYPTLSSRLENTLLWLSWNHTFTPAVKHYWMSVRFSMSRLKDEVKVKHLSNHSKSESDEIWYNFSGSLSVLQLSTLIWS